MRKYKLVTGPGSLGGVSPCAESVTYETSEHINRARGTSVSNCEPLRAEYGQRGDPLSEKRSPPPKLCHPPEKLSANPQALRACSVACPPGSIRRQGLRALPHLQPD